MKFSEWYEFNNKIRNFYLGPTYFNLFKKYSLNKEEAVTVIRMDLKDAIMFFNDYEIISVNYYLDNDIKRQGVLFNIYNPKINT